MRLTAVSYTFALVRAFLSPTNPDTASCSHFLPCLPNPRTSPYRNGCAGACALKRRETLVADADLSPLHTRQVKVSRNMPKVDGQVKVYCPMRCATQNLSIQRIWWVDTCASQRNTCDEPCHIGDVGAYASICSRRNSLEVPQQGARPEK